MWNSASWGPSRTGLHATGCKAAGWPAAVRTGSIRRSRFAGPTERFETRNIAGKSVLSIGAGTLITCLDEKITRKEVEPLALGIAEWHDELPPAGDSTMIFRDSAFVDDVAKTSLTAILEQRGLGNVRSL